MSRLNDIEISARIKLAMITNPSIGGFDVAVETVNGIVILTGVVETPEQKELASRIAVQNGGLDIKNDLAMIEQVAQPELGMVRQVAEQGSSFSEDASLRHRILGDMESDGRINAMMINVDEVAGTVRLSGVQETEEAKKRAEEITWRITGVHQVVNDIEVRSAEGRAA